MPAAEKEEDEKKRYFSFFSTAASSLLFLIIIIFYAVQFFIFISYFIYTHIPIKNILVFILIIINVNNSRLRGGSRPF